MEPKKKWIAYVGPFPFPWGKPGSRRVCGIARTLAEIGYNIVVGSGGSEPIAPVHLDEGEVPGTITYFGLGELPPSETQIISKLLQIFIHWGRKTVAWLDSLPSKPSHVIVFGGDAPYMFRLLPWCHRNRIPLLADVVEWYDPQHMSGGYWGPFHISAKIALRYHYPKCDGVIAVSSYLANHYRSQGLPVVCIPPTLDVSRVPINLFAESENASLLTMVYAGTPGKKDLLSNVIRGISMIDPDGERIRLLVLGPSSEQVKHLLGGANPPTFVQVLGRVPQANVAKIIQQADFSVLLREPLRFAQAGFPTKFVESLANGTPVMANLTSDLGRYLHDGIEGLICRDQSAGAFAVTLRRALHLTPTQRREMRLASRSQAERSFDFRTHTDALSGFIEEVRC